MKLNRRRIDARIPNWLYNELMAMAEKRGWSFTEILEATAEKGLNWYKKNWDKRNDVKSPDEPREEAGHDERRSNTHQDDNKLHEWYEQLHNSKEYRTFLGDRPDAGYFFTCFLEELSGIAYNKNDAEILEKAIKALKEKKNDGTNR